MVGRFVRDERGNVLIAILMTGFVLTVLGSAVFYVTNTELAESGHRSREVKAFYLAESGVDHAMLWLSQQSQPPPGVDAFDPFDGAQHFAYGVYGVTVQPDSTNPRQTNIASLPALHANSKSAQWTSGVAFIASERIVPEGLTA